MTNVLMGVVSEAPTTSTSRAGGPITDLMVRVDRQAEVGSGRWSPLDPAVCHVRAFGDLAQRVAGTLAVDEPVVVVGSIVPGPWDPDEELESVPRRIVADVVTRPLTDQG